MFTTRKKSVEIVAPLALAGALLFTGCSTAVSTEAAPVATGTGITTVAELQNNIDTWDEDLDASLEQLSLDLNAAAAAGVSEINVASFGEESVTVNVLTDDTEGTLTGDQLQAVIGVLRSYEPTTPVESYTISGWTKDFYQGNSEKAAIEIGVQADFIDSDWHEVVIPGDQLKNVYL